MGDLRGKKVLDIGSGLGESSVYLALQGAKVTTTDISPQMVQTILALGKKFGVEMEGIVSSGRVIERATTTPSISSTWPIQFITSRTGTSCFVQMKRALKPGGKFFSFDPLAYNPAINVYRRMATLVRTPDEAPLTSADVDLARKYFPDTQHREFWIASLMLFVKYYAMDRLHPNADRYWKTDFPRERRWAVVVAAVAGVGRDIDPYAGGEVAVLEHGDVGKQAEVAGCGGVARRQRVKSHQSD